MLKSLEDLGYYAVDNLPIDLIPKFAELSRSALDIMLASGDSVGIVSAAFSLAQALWYSGDICLQNGQTFIFLCVIQKSRLPTLRR